MRHLIFLDLHDVVTEVEFSDDVKGNVRSAKLLTWTLIGLPDYPLEQIGRTSQFYIQIKFEGCLECHTVTNAARGDMFPLPLMSLNDWSPTNLNIPLPVRFSPWVRRFKVSLFSEGANPTPFNPVNLAGGFRLLLWIEVETEL